MSKQTTITPHDLRIGSRVRLKGSAPVKILEVTAIGQKHITARSGEQAESSTWSYAEIEPVPLTDGIMGKCGFCHPMHDELWRHKPSCVDVLVVDDWDEYTRPWITVNDNFMFPSIHCRYLHELQNCYFAVEGEELEVKM